MISLIPYLGYGDDQEVVFYFRLLYRYRAAEFKNIKNFNRWQNFKRFFYRYNVKPASNVDVLVKFESQEVTVTSDKAGLIEVAFPITKSHDNELHQATAHLNDQKYVVEALVDIQNNEYAIVTDIDDTLIISNSWSKRRLIPLTIFSNSSTRKSFDGAADFYQSLVKGSNSTSTNPIFYVSSSHWNLFDFLKNFLERNNFPRGPLLLKETSGWIDMLRSVNNHHHKHEKISQLIETYQDLNFVLIGDSTQADAQIYTDLAIKYKGRIKHIFLRDVTVFKDPIVEEALSLARENNIEHMITVGTNTNDFIIKAKKIKLI